MELVILLIILALLFFLFQFFSNNKKNKTSVIKKDELIQNYHNDMLRLRASCDGDENLFKQKKLEYLKKTSHELHNNIFFDESEAKQIIKDLANY